MNFFIIDIDGCITQGRNKPISISSIEKLKRTIHQRNLQCFICTGRSAPYAEAIHQILQIEPFAICENGSYIYNFITHKYILSPQINLDKKEELSKVRKLFFDKKHLYTIELGKDFSISLNPKKNNITEEMEIVSKIINKKLLEVNYSKTAIDITPLGVNKRSGVELLLKKTNIDLKETLTIGDSLSDISFMELSKTKATPANACQEVKDISDYISPLKYTEGVIDILEKFG